MVKFTIITLFQEALEPYLKSSMMEKATLGGEQSVDIESFSDGDNLEYPQYARPEDFRGMKVPEVLLSGNHGEIAKRREEHSGGINKDSKRRHSKSDVFCRSSGLATIPPLVQIRISCHS